MMISFSTALQLPIWIGILTLLTIRLRSSNSGSNSSEKQLESRVAFHTESILCTIPEGQDLEEDDSEIGHRQSIEVALESDDNDATVSLLPRIARPGLQFETEEGVLNTTDKNEEPVIADEDGNDENDEDSPEVVPCHSWNHYLPCKLRSRSSISSSSIFTKQSHGVLLSTTAATA